MDGSRHRVTGWPERGLPVHAARPRPAIGRLAAITVAVAATLGAVGFGVASCLSSTGPSRSTPTSASFITTTPTVDNSP